MKTIAIYSNKGGVGKTTTAVNLSYISSLQANKTLICDLDPQGSASYYFRVVPKIKKKARQFLDAEKINKSIKGTDFHNLDILPGDFSHRELDTTFYNMKKPYKQLNILVEEFQDEYDYMILDCPPSINVLAENIFNVADIIVVPLIPTTLSIRAHNQLLNFLKESNYDNKKVYTFFSMADRRKNLHNEIIEGVPKKLKNFKNSTIPYTSQVEQMGVYKEPFIKFAPNTEAANSYFLLWRNIIKEL